MRVFSELLVVPVARCCTLLLLSSSVLLLLSHQDVAVSEGLLRGHLIIISAAGLRRLIPIVLLLSLTDIIYFVFQQILLSVRQVSTMSDLYLTLFAL